MVAREWWRRLNPGSAARVENPPMSNTCPACGPAFLQWLASDPARHAVWLALPRRSVGPGQELQAAGGVMGAVWFVEQGLLRSHFLDERGRERNCAFHPEAQWAGRPATRGPPAAAPFAIDALEGSRVVELTYAALAKWLNERPELQSTLTDALSANLMSLSHRESTLMMDTAERRYVRFLAEQPGIASRIALHHVASYLGITNVALSRIRRRIKDRQLPVVNSCPTLPRKG